MKKLVLIFSAIAALCIMCYSCGNNGDNAKNENVNESSEPIQDDKDSLAAISELFDNAAYRTINVYVAKEDIKLDWENYQKGDTIGSEGGVFGLTYVKSKGGNYSFTFCCDEYTDIPKSKVEAQSGKVYGISSNVLDNWTLLFEDQEGKTARIFKVDYNGHRIEDGYQCVFVEEQYLNENYEKCYFGGGENGKYLLKDDNGNIYFDPSIDYSTMAMENSDYTGNYYDGVKLLCNLRCEGDVSNWEYKSVGGFDAEKRTLGRYTFKGLIRNK